MADNEKLEPEEEREEDKLDAFTPEAEALGYISLEQARVLAIQHARDNREIYGSRYAATELVWEVISFKAGEDYYEILLSYRPAGRFRGVPGVEKITIDKTGSIELRMVLDEPSEPARKLPPPPLLAAAGLLVIVGIVLGVLFGVGIIGRDGEPTPVPGVVNFPTARPTSTPSPRTSTPTPVPVVVTFPTAGPASTSIPRASTPTPPAPLTPTSVEAAVPTDTTESDPGASIATLTSTPSLRSQTTTPTGTGTEAPGPQYAVPISDVDHGNWAHRAGDGSISAFDELDEGLVTGSADDAASYWEGPDAGTLVDRTIRLNMTPLEDPGSHTGHVVRIRSRKSRTTGFGGVQQRVSVYSAGRLVFTSVTTGDLDNPWRTYSFTLPESAAARLTDYGDIDVEVENLPDELNDFSWLSAIELEVPAPAPTPAPIPPTATPVSTSNGS